MRFVRPGGRWEPSALVPPLYTTAVWTVLLLGSGMLNGPSGTWKARQSVRKRECHKKKKKKTLIRYTVVSVYSSIVFWLPKCCFFTKAESRFPGRSTRFNKPFAVLNIFSGAWKR